MKVRLIKEKTIQEYMTANAQSRTSFTGFIQLIKVADWNTLEDVQKTFPRASIVCEGKRVVFRIGGNQYRMICGIMLGKKYVFLFVKFIGTHAAYDNLKICEVDNY